MTQWSAIFNSGTKFFPKQCVKIKRKKNVSRCIKRLNDTQQSRIIFISQDFTNNKSFPATKPSK